MPDQKILLAIGGFDPCGYSGLLADARVFHNYKIPYRAVATAITAQSKSKFLEWRPVSPALFRRELEAVEGNLYGAKIGMIGTHAHAKILLEWLQAQALSHVVWDPVHTSSTGFPLLRAKNFSPIFRKLAQISTTLTPNIPEAKWILGKSFSATEIATTVQRLHDLGIQADRTIILKGGHDSAQAGDNAVSDWILHRGILKKFSVKRRPFQRRGTGCAFAAAYLAEIFKGKNPFSAGRAAQKYVLKRIFDTPTP